MSYFLLFAGYLTASVLFQFPELYAPVAGAISLMWWTSVFGKAAVLGTMITLIGSRLKTLSLSWKEAGWGKVEPLRELAWAGVCALIVWGISFFLLPDDANRGAVEKAEILKANASGKFMLFLSSCLLTGMLEELIYRGALRAFICGRRENDRRADAIFVAVSAIVFASFHWLSSPIFYVVYAGMGAVLATVLVASGSLRAVMLAHILVNTAHLLGLGNYIRWRLGIG